MALEWTYPTATLHITREMAAEIRGFHSSLCYVSEFVTKSCRWREGTIYFPSRSVNIQENSETL